MQVLLSSIGSWENLSHFCSDILACGMEFSKLGVYETLETQINESEAACGRMLQRYLDLGRAITLRQKQLQDDKESLLRIQQMRGDRGQELDSVLTRISNLVNGTEDTP